MPSIIKYAVNHEQVKDKIITSAIAHAYEVNNWLDDDVIMDGITNLKEAQTDQEVYEALLYISTAINYRKKDTKSEQYAKDYAANMSLLQHVNEKNGEAIEQLEQLAKSGLIIRLI